MFNTSSNDDLEALTADAAHGVDIGTLPLNTNPRSPRPHA